jgi:hypothetical protein
MAMHDSAFGEFVFSAAIRAFHRSCVYDVQKDTWMHTPKWSFVTWAVKG